MRSYPVHYPTRDLLRRLGLLKQGVEKYTYISSPLFITYTIIAAFGIIIATMCLICNLWLRNQKYIVMLLTMQEATCNVIAD